MSPSVPSWISDEWRSERNSNKKGGGRSRIYTFHLFLSLVLILCVCVCVWGSFFYSVLLLSFCMSPYHNSMIKGSPLHIWDNVEDVSSPILFLFWTIHALWAVDKSLHDHDRLIVINLSLHGLMDSWHATTQSLTFWIDCYKGLFVQFLHSKFVVFWQVERARGQSEAKRCEMNRLLFIENNFFLVSYIQKIKNWIKSDSFFSLRTNILTLNSISLVPLDGRKKRKAVCSRPFGEVQFR